MTDDSSWIAYEDERLIGYGKVSHVANDFLCRAIVYSCIPVGNVSVCTKWVEPLSREISLNGLRVLVARTAVRFWSNKRLSCLYRRKMLFRQMFENGPLC